MNQVTINSFTIDFKADFDVELIIPEKHIISFNLLPKSENGVKFLNYATSSERMIFIQLYISWKMLEDSKKEMDALEAKLDESIEKRAEVA